MCPSDAGRALAYRPRNLVGQELVGRGSRRAAAKDSQPQNCLDRTFVTSLPTAKLLAEFAMSSGSIGGLTVLCVR
jgi:hypothetical protein